MGKLKTEESLTSLSRISTLWLWFKIKTTTTGSDKEKHSAD